MGGKIKNIVSLSKTDRDYLEKIVNTGKNGARLIRRANILLQADSSEEGPCLSDRRISEQFGVCTRTVARLRSLYTAKGVACIRRAKHKRYKPRKLDGEAEAHLIALVCSDPPEGHSQWSLRLLADRLVYLEIVDSIGHEAVRRALKKTNLSLGKNNAGASAQSATPPSSAPWKKS